MDNNPAFVRRICQAKAFELAGNRAAAIARLDEAARLTGQADDLMQLAAWKTRLETVPSKPPARKRKSCPSPSAENATKVSSSTRKG